MNTQLKLFDINNALLKFDFSAAAVLKRDVLIFILQT